MGQIDWLCKITELFIKYPCGWDFLINTWYRYIISSVYLVCYITIWDSLRKRLFWLNRFLFVHPYYQILNSLSLELSLEKIFAVFSQSVMEVWVWIMLATHNCITVNVMHVPVLMFTWYRYVICFLYIMKRTLRNQEKSWFLIFQFCYIKIWESLRKGWLWLILFHCLSTLYYQIFSIIKQKKVSFNVDMFFVFLLQLWRALFFCLVILAVIAVFILYYIHWKQITILKIGRCSFFGIIC